MNEYLSLLSKVTLFQKINSSELQSMLICLNAEIRQYKKGEFIIFAGDKVQHIGVMLEGNAHILKDDYEGERTIIATLARGDYFAEAICCAGVHESPVSVAATNDVKIMMLAFSRILHSCPNSCTFHTQMIENMLYSIARKNISLQNRIDVIGQRTLRMKILHYLQSFALHQGKTVTIPFNRQEFAEFLCVDRSALSHELSRMKQDGLIEYRKNKFLLQ